MHQGRKGHLKEETYCQRTRVKENLAFLTVYSLIQFSNFLVTGTQDSWKLSLWGFLCNLGSAEWLPQRRVARREPFCHLEVLNTPTAFTSAPMEWVSRSASLWHSERSWEFAMEETGTQDVCTDTRLHKAVWARGVRNALYRVWVLLSRTHEDEDSPNKYLGWLPWYLPPL